VDILPSPAATEIKDQIWHAMVDPLSNSLSK